MNITKNILLATTLLLATASATSADTTTPTTIDDLKGRIVRVVYPGEITTMDCRLDRVTIYVDADNKITRVSFC